MALSKSLLYLAKMIGIFGLSLLGIGLLAAGLFVYLSPEFGGRATAAEQEVYARSDNHAKGKFTNLIPTSMTMDGRTMASILRDYVRGVPHGVPSVPPPVVSVDSLTIAQAPDTLTRVIWFGHSGGAAGDRRPTSAAGPHAGQGARPAPPGLGQSRFSERLPIAIEQLPAIDAVLISHDHYDHLDYGSIRRLKDKVNDFYVPRGVGGASAPLGRGRIGHSRTQLVGTRPPAR